MRKGWLEVCCGGCIGIEYHNLKCDAIILYAVNEARKLNRQHAQNVRSGRTELLVVLCEEINDKLLTFFSQSFFFWGGVVKSLDLRS